MSSFNKIFSDKSRYDGHPRAEAEHAIDVLCQAYPVTHREIANLRDRNMAPALRLSRMSLPDAMDAIRKTNDPRSPLKKSRVEAFHRLTRAFQIEAFREIPRSIIALAIFNDLDIALFNGRLRNQVCLLTVSLEAGMRAGVAASTNPTRMHSRRVCITIASEGLGEVRHLRWKLGMSNTERMSELMTTLIHEMVHAYLLVRCGFEEHRRDISDRGQGHGVSFSRTLAAIQETLYIAGWRLDMSEGGQYPLNR